MLKLEVRGLQFMDLIDLLDKHGYGSVSAIRGFTVNPLEWPRKQWRFALDLISQSTGLSEEKVRQLKPKELLNIFNEAMRKTGLIIQLTQTTRISEAAALSQWDEVWKNERT